MKPLKPLRNPRKDPLPENAEGQSETQNAPQPSSKLAKNQSVLKNRTSKVQQEKSRGKPGPKPRSRVTASPETRQTIYLSPSTKKLVKKQGDERDLPMSRVLEDCAESILRMKSPVLSRFYRDVESYFDQNQGTPPWKILEEALSAYYAQNPDVETES
ncbi:hypothetical protein [Deinococcus cellulosilyticus]|uniref:Uncharacterized protein n=1 Tax=Deinococcus cellulosilyticus (strain DSM 18568 / NBRC 106333 / KACC 11606 / 5516J-15) TaxID=1223518 RepID=A0A511NA21_DEIC1|nr:hypothetical protein [Deinococcus cellulosilyticus]GEM49650.1 hypothetical protein DC3_52850 [Deinococcus cellulosilyticus NBRC 106333 = KACC 11606]